MKLRTMMVAALAALTLAACSKDGSNPTEGPDGPEISGEKAYATFAITVTDANTRAFHGSTTPTADEAEVHQLTVYIYDVATSTVEEVLTFADEDDTKTNEITTGSKKFLATSGMNPVLTKGDNVADVESLMESNIDEDFFDNNLTVAQKFWMTSDIVNHVVTSATEAEAETPGNNNYIVMRLGRAMAKIGVSTNVDAKMNVVDNSSVVLGTLHDIEYKVKNQPNAMFIFTGYENSVWRTPYFDFNDNVWSSAQAGFYWHQANYSTTALDAGGNHVQPTYMMENSNMVARYGSATYVAIKGSFVPAKWCDENGNDVTTTVTPGKGQSFWRIGEVEFEADGTTVKEFKNWRADNKFYHEVPSVGELGVNGAAFEYVNGEMYYYLYLNNTLGQANPTNSADKYSQHRNQYWDVEINSITGLGSTEEDGDRPEDPKPLDDTAYIHATIQVLKWVGVSMPGDLTGN